MKTALFIHLQALKVSRREVEKKRKAGRNTEQ